MARPNLTRSLLLEAPTRLPDGAGGYSEGWVQLGRHWAEVLAVGAGGEAAGVATVLSRVRYRITVRAAPVGSTARPLADQRFRDGTRIFRILSVAERDPGGRYLVCLSEEETAT